MFDLMHRNGKWVVVIKTTLHYKQIIKYKSLCSHLEEDKALDWLYKTNGKLHSFQEKNIDLKIIIALTPYKCRYKKNNRFEIYLETNSIRIEKRGT